MVDLEFLSIERLIVHTIPTSRDRQQAEPILSEETIDIGVDGMDMFNRRIATALGHKSHGIKVDFREIDAGSFLQSAGQILSLDEPQFIRESGALAARLCRAQGIKKLSPSKLIVMTGKTGEFQRPFLAVVKADMQDALSERQDGQRTTVDYVKNVFMTPSQTLYKIGFVQQIHEHLRGNGADGLHSKDEFAIHLFDHLLTGSETRSAAYYFYGEFLGADIAASDKRLTQDFFEKTNKFFDSCDFAPDVRIEMGEALRAELRSNTQTISVADFGAKYLGVANSVKYAEYMDRSAFPNHAISKNVEYIKSRLKRRQKFTFTSGVMITTPADQIGLVTIDNAVDGKTVVTIEGTVTRQE